ncbi:MAG TPA: glycosyltransferase [Acidimicrobiales bacterium]|jgi:glycosyltransferase involved in cell wall biosynthesis|nr:glycosyltransferase [Acidimicrobiales bacterium]
MGLKLEAPAEEGFGAGGRLLSVMIPIWNCRTLLPETLASLLDQGIEDAQIEVLDDQSDDRPEDVVEAFGGLPVRFFRHPGKVGMIGNFNACIERAERPWVHILHGDDFVLPGAYGRVADVVRSVPDAGAVFGRSVTVDGASRWRSITPILGPDRFGRLAYRPEQWGLTPVQFAGVFFRREAAIQLGGFAPLRPHTADWDLWWRLARTGTAAYTNECIGAYREHEASDSSMLRRDGENLRQSLAQLEAVMSADGRTDADVAERLMRFALVQAEQFWPERRVFARHVRIIWRFPKAVAPRRRVIRLIASLSTRSRRPAT